MDKRSLVLYLSGLAAAGAVIGLAASCSDQPRIKCTAGHGLFALKYATSGENCGIFGEQMGVEAYNYPLDDRTNVNTNRGSLGMQPESVDNAKAARGEAGEDTNPAHKPYSLGDWGSPEPSTTDEFCTVPVINPIEQDFPAVAANPDGGEPTGGPALSLKYQWSNVRFYNTPASAGNQMVADLTYSKTVDGGTCTAQFHVTGLWPSVSCADDTAPDGIDPTWCNSDADPSKNRSTGSGISSDINWACDPVLKMCVLAKDPPSLK
ncbi:MAG TPA: hypothetical protein VK550_00080 [Polyangiaceae bacterium]|nr:hypothetical protein [Polyangiaceae bacterium]